MNFDSLAALIKAIPTISTLLKGKNLSGQQAAQSQMAQLADAQYNEQNPLFQQVYGQERQAGQQDLASAIAEASRQNRKLGMLGRTPLFSQERGGEEIFRNLTKGYQDVQGAARDRAFNILRGGQNAQANVYKTAQSLSGDQFTNSAMGAAGYGQISDYIRNLMGKQNQLPNTTAQDELARRQQNIGYEEVQGLPWRTTTY